MIMNGAPPFDPESEHALFGISVAAELTGVTPQALRGYEDKGLISPYRTDGGTRRYSGADLDTVQHITTLLAAGVNLAGIAYVLQARAENRRLRDELDELRHALPR